MTDSSATVAALGERALIDRLRRRIPPPPPYVILGVGDDAAVLEPERGRLDVVTTDALVEHVHFRRDWTPPGAIGHKALAVNLSDLAAMGATPRAVVLSLLLPDDLPVADFDAMLDGFLALADATGTPLVGGNISRSPGPLVLDVTAIGAVHRRKMLRRSGARPGHELYVTGAIGGAAAGLGLLATGAAGAPGATGAGAGRPALDAALRECVEAYERPVPRLRIAAAVARSRAASAAMDLSDGLADAARQIAQACDAGVTIDAGSLPIHPGALDWCRRSAIDPASFALSGGEDYELLFAVAPRMRNRFLNAVRRAHGPGATRIGRLNTEPGEWLERAGSREPLPPGFAHFPR